jgi:hypothetical protein
VSVDQWQWLVIGLLVLANALMLVVTAPRRSQHGDSHRRWFTR